MKISSYKRLLVIGVMVVFGLYLVMNLYAIFYRPTHRFLPARIWNHVFLPGPFFGEDRIKVVPRYQVTFYENGTWTPWLNPEKQNFLAYHDNYLRYDKLVRSNLDRSLGRALSRRVGRVGKDSVFRFREFRVFNRYLNAEYTRNGADSVKIIYLLQQYIPGQFTTLTDTSFVLTYKTEKR